MRIVTFLTTALALCGFIQPAAAAASAWHKGEGAGIRVVASGLPSEDGALQAALEIALEPGWKTYWADPGEAGVPPVIEATADGRPIAVEVAFPAPERIDDGYSVWSGYKHPVSLALTLRLPDGAVPETIDFDVFLGVCETICIPVQARLQLQADTRMIQPGDAAAVAKAFAALPGAAKAGFEARATGFDGKTLRVAADVPEEATVSELFLVGTDAMALGTPERDAANGFSVPVDMHRGDAPETIGYTLVTSAGAVSGTLALPR